MSRSLLRARSARNEVIKKFSMHIVQLIPSLNEGGTERGVVDLNREFVRRGICNTVISPIRQAVFRKAALLQIAGHEKEAEMELQRAITSYPKDITSALMQMEEDEDARSVLQPLIDRLRATL